MQMQWVPFVFGTVMSLAGTTFLIFRVPLTRFVSDSRQGLLGRFATRRQRRPSNPWGIGAAGIFGIALGLAIVILSAVLPPHHG